VLVVAIGVLGFVPQANNVVSNSTVDIRSVVLTIYYMYATKQKKKNKPSSNPLLPLVSFFGLLIIIFTVVFPPQIGRYFGFYQTYFGRGLFFIFLGVLILTNVVLNIVTCCLLAVLGIMFMIFSILSCIAPLPHCKPLIPSERLVVPVPERLSGNSNNADKHKAAISAV